METWKDMIGRKEKQFAKELALSKELFIGTMLSIKKDWTIKLRFCNLTPINLVGRDEDLLVFYSPKTNQFYTVKIEDIENVDIQERNIYLSKYTVYRTIGSGEQFKIKVDFR